MFSEIKINGIILPAPDEDPEFGNKKSITEYETEAGTTQVSVRRASKLKISGKWTLTGRWIQQFRTWAEDDTVSVSCFFPSKTAMSVHTCQFVIESEKHILRSREQLSVDGLYEVSVSMEEL